jgi:hypothetical protein
MREVVKDIRRLRYKAIRGRFHRVQHCNRVLVDRRKRDEEELNDSEWSDEVRA